MGHQTLDPKSKAYWQFDWETYGTHDDPAIIDHILDVTGFEKVSYIGHSVATT